MLKRFIIFVTFPVLFDAKSLPEDLEDFMYSLPINHIDQVYNKHMRSDHELTTALLYLQGASFQRKLREFNSSVPFRKVVLHYERRNISIVGELSEYFEDLVKTARPKASPASQGSFLNLTEEVIDLLDIRKLKMIFKDKVKNDPQSRANYKELVNETVWKNVRGSQQYQVLRQDLLKVKLINNRVLETLMQIFSVKILKSLRKP